MKVRERVLWAIVVIALMAAVAIVVHTLDMSSYGSNSPTQYTTTTVPSGSAAFTTASSMDQLMTLSEGAYGNLAPFNFTYNFSTVTYSGSRTLGAAPVTHQLLNGTLNAQRYGGVFLTTAVIPGWVYYRYIAGGTGNEMETNAPLGTPLNITLVNMYNGEALIGCSNLPTYSYNSITGKPIVYWTYIPICTYVPSTINGSALSAVSLLAPSGVYNIQAISGLFHLPPQSVQGGISVAYSSKKYILGQNCFQENISASNFSGTVLQSGAYSECISGVYGVPLTVRIPPTSGYSSTFNMSIGAVGPPPTSALEIERITSPTVTTLNESSVGQFEVHSSVCNATVIGLNMNNTEMANVTFTGVRIGKGQTTLAPAASVTGITGSLYGESYGIIKVSGANLCQFGPYYLIPLQLNYSISGAQPGSNSRRKGTVNITVSGVGSLYL